MKKDMFKYAAAGGEVIKFSRITAASLIGRFWTEYVKPQHLQHS
jgi:hypothetical protein